MYIIIDNVNVYWRVVSDRFKMTSSV